MRKNIFDLEDPENYYCMVKKFSGRAVLQIEVSSLNKPRDLFYLAFFSVEFFSGPMTWHSADFCLATPEESIETFKLIERFADTSSAELLSSRYDLKLYTVETPGNTVRIVASDVKRHTEAWALS